MEEECSLQNNLSNLIVLNILYQKWATKIWKLHDNLHYENLSYWGFQINHFSNIDC